MIRFADDGFNFIGNVDVSNVDRAKYLIVDTAKPNWRNRRVYELKKVSGP